MFHCAKYMEEESVPILLLTSLALSLCKELERLVPFCDIKLFKGLKKHKKLASVWATKIGCSFFARAKSITEDK